MKIFPGMLCRVLEKAYLWIGPAANAAELTILGPEDLVLVLSDELSPSYWSGTMPPSSYSTVLSRAGIGLFYNKLLDKV